MSSSNCSGDMHLLSTALAPGDSFHQQGRLRLGACRNSLLAMRLDVVLTMRIIIVANFTSFINNTPVAAPRV